MFNVSVQPSPCDPPVSAKEIHILARWAAFLISTLLMEHHAMVNQAEWTWWRQMPISSTPLVKSSITQRWPRQAGMDRPAHAMTALPRSTASRNTNARVHTIHTSSHQHPVNFLHSVCGSKSYQPLQVCLCLFKLKHHHHSESHGARPHSCKKSVLTFNPLQSWKAHILPRKLKGIVAGSNGVTFAFPIDYIAARHEVFVAGFKTKQLVIVPVLICKTTNSHIIFACSFIQRPVWEQKCAKMSRLTPDIDTSIYEKRFGCNLTNEWNPIS